MDGLSVCPALFGEVQIRILDASSSEKTPFSLSYLSIEVRCAHSDPIEISNSDFSLPVVMLL